MFWQVELGWGTCGGFSSKEILPDGRKYDSFQPRQGWGSALWLLPLQPETFQPGQPRRSPVAREMDGGLSHTLSVSPANFSPLLGLTFFFCRTDVNGTWPLSAEPGELPLILSVVLAQLRYLGASGSPSVC